jgi:hypothetical protein
LCFDTYLGCPGLTKCVIYLLFYFFVCMCCYVLFLFCLFKLQCSVQLFWGQRLTNACGILYAIINVVQWQIIALGCDHWPMIFVLHELTLKTFSRCMIVTLLHFEQVLCLDLVAFFHFCHFKPVLCFYLVSFFIFVFIFIIFIT